MKMLKSLMFSIVLASSFGCGNPATNYLPVETPVRPTKRDLVYGGAIFDANGNITHLLDDDDGEWLPLDDAKQLNEKYRELVRSVGRPRGYQSSRTKDQPRTYDAVYWRDDQLKQ